MTTEAAQTALVEQLTVPGAESKKFRMVVAGMVVDLAIVVLAGCAFLFNPAALQPLLAFAATAIASVSGLVAVYCGSQAAVDYRTTASLGK